MRSLRLGRMLALVFGLLLAIQSPSYAWGGLGHRTVAAIAQALLPSEKAARMNALLGNFEIDNNFIDAASYPDEWIRDHDPSKGNWHFVDIPDGDPAGALASCSDCLYQALADNLAKLKAGSGGYEEAYALAWVIHLVGDMHQPLHMEERLRGGNDFHVKYQGKASCPNSYTKAGHSKVELHSTWDDCLVEELSTELIGHSHDPQGLAKKILGHIGSYKERPELASSTDPVWIAWGDSSHQLAMKVAFDSLTDGADLEDAYTGGQDFANKPDSALLTVEHQLLTAGIRLAMLLDQNFSS